MKKFFSVMLMSSLVIGGLTINPTSNLAAETEKPEVVYEKKEIKDLETLYERAVNDISDRKTGFTQEAELENKKEGVTEEPEVYTTTQLVKQTEDKDGDVDSYYVSTSFVDIQDDIGGDDASASATYGSRYASGWDRTGGVKAYSTVKYKVAKYDSVPYHDITNVSGGWKRDDTSIALSSRKVVIGQSGGSRGCGAVTQTKNYYPTGNTYSYNPPASWCTVSTAVGSIGTTSTVTLKRGKSTWSLKLQNNNK